MVMSQGQALSSLRCEATKIVSYSLFQGFQGLESGALFGGMNTNTFQGTVIHGKEDSRLAVFGGESSSHICAPHIVDPIGGDSAVMDSWPRGAAPAMRRQELVFSHQTQNPSFRGSDASIAESGPHFAISFPMKRALGQDGLDMLHQLSIATRPLRSWSHDSIGRFLWFAAANRW
jgi:hypothetical protein